MASRWTAFTGEVWNLSAIIRVWECSGNSIRQILTVASEEQVKRQPSFWLTVKELALCSWGRKESTHLRSEIRQTLRVLS